MPLWFIPAIVGGICYGGRRLEKHRLEKAQEDAENFAPPEIYGEGDGFTTAEQCSKSGLFGFSGLRLGKHAQSGRDIRLKKDGHVIAFGPSGSSKTSSLVFQNLDAKASNYLNDGKGAEITHVAGRYLASEGRYLALAPYGLGGPTPPGVKLARFNPMYPMFRKGAKPRHRATAMTLADGALSKEDRGRNAFFTNGARELYAMGIVGVARYGKPEEKNLPAVAQAMCGDFMGFCQWMVSTGDKELITVFNGHLHALKTQSKGFADILETLKQGVAWLLDPCIAEMLSGDDFEWEEMGESPMTVALCIPMNEVAANGKAGRLITASCLYALQTPERSRRVKINLFLDEAASFGTLDCLVGAYATARAFGIRLWSFWQDKGALHELYGQRGQSLISNSVAQIWFSSKDSETSSYLAQQGGKTTIVTPGRSVTYDREGYPTVTKQQGIHPREVIGVRDVADLPEDQALVWIRGVPGVLKIRHTPYFKQFRYRLRFDKNPLYRKDS